MRFLLVDNFDSFTYNIVHYLEQCDVDVHVVTNVDVRIDSLESFDALVLSPGPGLPNEAGKLMPVVAEAMRQNKPILGVCLGMQALAIHSGDSLYNQEIVKHGLAEEIRLVKKDSLFYNDIPEVIEVGLYHSWAVELTENSPFIPTATSESGVLMSMEIAAKKVYAVQFHPESILTPTGLRMIQNFVGIVRED
ncbi:anthranilate synthase component II [Fluviicola taffensis]|uniref:Glutamine amidotransferase of anthranilate synthase n=1 Tax=Fluviicola taffensis (strain DSM 16823 / NCIMB 13979 / RW262) TaxID=755732 RepID=F2IFF0_FLUTR|nr:aminodeoxychorismate/anthranilate synthase component II [Fluviicola taffensis]AEA44635.1 glutamine amidotransferase of anthranilate synthase [Fluviicola taffensis DSM 16823]